MTLPPFLTAKSWLLEPSGLVCCVLLEQRRLEPRRGDRRFPRRQSSDNLASGTTGSNLLSSTDESCSLGEKGVDDVIGRRTTPRPYRKYGMTSWANSVIDCFTSVGSISPPWLK